jgi:hypothetical protein
MVSMAVYGVSSDGKCSRGEGLHVNDEAVIDVYHRQCVECAAE